ncbi:MAG TPA: TRAM domain-containing protein [Gemmatimonadaceae bacterium]
MTAVERVTVESIAAGGDGVARAGSLVVFVPRTAPGDVADVAIESRGRFARGRVTALREPSPLRVDPPCAHYVRDRCGGCQLQHLSDDAQRAAKARIIGDAVRRIGKRDVADPEVRAPGRPWRYRRKLTLALRRRGDRWIAGLHPYDAPARVFALDDCPITDERVVAVWREVMAAAAELPRAAELRGAVRLADDGAAFVLEGGTRWPRSAAFFDRAPSLASVWWVPEGRGRVRLHERGTGTGRATGASFAQVNAEVAAALREHVVARAVAHEPRTVVDAYAGVGDTAAALAAGGRSVTAIELDPDAAAWAASRLPAGSRALAARVEDALPGALPADVVILNPPRRGVDERVTAALDAARPAPRAVLYVSCNPATLARDVARMPNWRIASLVAFDMFPQTAHVETACELVPESA